MVEAVVYSVPAKEMLHIEVGLFKIRIVSVLSICLLCSASSWMCQNIYSSLPYSKLLHNNIQQCFTFLKNTKRLDLKRRGLDNELCINNRTQWISTPAQLYQFLVSFCCCLFVIIFLYGLLHASFLYHDSQKTLNRKTEF